MVFFQHLSSLTCTARQIPDFIEEDGERSAS
jgi:hypothetical protein